MYLSKTKRRVDSPWLRALREEQKKEQQEHALNEAHTALEEVTLRQMRLQI